MASFGPPCRSELMPALLLPLALSLAGQAWASPLSSAAVYSAASYCPAGRIRSGGLASACSSLSLADASVLQGRVTQCPQVGGSRTSKAFVTTDESLRSVVVSFEGTDVNSVNSVLLDLTAFPTRCKVADSAPLPGIVHAGFCCYYRSIVKAGLVEQVRKRLEQHPGYQLFITGHSLGGAGAQLAGVDLAQRLKPSGTVVYTFGSPRAGTNEFNAALAAHTGGANVVDAEDVIPKMPPNWPPTIRQSVVPAEWRCSAPFGLPLPPVLNICGNLLAHIFYLGMEIPNLCCQGGPAARWARLCMRPPSFCRRRGSDAAALEAAPAGGAANSTAPGPLASPGPGGSSASATQAPDLVFP